MKRKEPVLNIFQLKRNTHNNTKKNYDENNALLKMFILLRKISNKQVKIDEHLQGCS